MKQTTAIKSVFLALVCMLTGIFAQAQVPTYEMYITNQSQVSSKIYQFDVYVLRTGATSLEMASMQFGLGYDTSITNGGTITFSFVAGSSQLVASQVPQAFQSGTVVNSVNGVSYRYLNQAARSGPGAGNGTVISATKTDCSSPGTRIGTYRVTNTVDFREASTAKHIFNVTAGSGRTATAVSAYVAGVNTVCTGTRFAYNDAGSCDQNLSLNGCSVVANAAPTAITCFGLSNGSVSVSLSGAGVQESGTYSINGGASIAYTSNPFVISGLAAGTYSVAISSGTCSASTGNFTVGGPAGPSVSTTTETACGSFTWNGTTYNASGTYTANLTSSTGCDSTATLNLTINDASSSSDDVSICASALPYSWNGQSITEAGTYTANLTNAVGCDSTATLNLTVNSASSSSINLSICSTTLPTTWNGVSITGAGTYTATLTNAAGCDSVVTATVTTTAATPGAPTAIAQTLLSNTCGARQYRLSTAAVTNAAGYNWIVPTSVGGVSGMTVDSGDVNSSRIIVVTFASNKASTSADSVKVRAFSGCGNSAYKAAKLTNTILSVPAVPASVTITAVQTTVCGSRIYRYSAPALPGASATATAATAAATGYVWSFTGTLGANATIDSGDVNSRTILVSYTSNVAAGAGDSVKVLYTSDCGNGLAKAAKLTNIAIVPPAAPSALTITAVQTNVCGARIYRYSAPALPGAAGLATGATAAATGYVWSFTGTLGANATIDSGDVNSRTIVVSFTSNTAAGAGDSVRVLYTSDCGNSLRKTAKLSNSALATPGAPTAITISVIQANVCGNKKFRYSAPVLPGASATAGAATGYVWSFTGTLGANAVVDSGTLNSRTIVVSYNSNAAAGAGDSVKVLYTSDCGNGAAKAAKLTNTVTVVPAAPTAITITALQTNVCGVRKYRYSAPNLPAGTATAAPATGYVWDFVGSLAEFATIDSGDVNSQRLILTFSSNAAAAAGDSIRVYYTSSCGNSLRKTAKFSNLKLSAPAAPSALTITAIQTNVCGARKYRYSAPALPAASTTAGVATGYEWSFVGSLASTMTVDSGSLTSRTLTVTFTSNAAAGAGDSVRVLYTSDCGNSLRKTAKLSNTAIVAPGAPASITIALKEDVCNARKYRYIAPAPLPGATATAGAASGYLWTLPTGTVGSTGTLDSGSLGDRIIVVSYTSNAAAGAGDSIRVRYTSGCGNGAIKAQKLSNLLKAGCPPPTITKAPVTQAPKGSMVVKVYPNPTTSQFNVQVNTTGSEEAVVRILDVQGRFVKSVKVAANQVIGLGAELKAGAYMLEVKQGNEVKTTRVIKF